MVKPTAIVTQDETGPLYICLQPERQGETGVAARTKTVFREGGLTIVVDYDANGKVYGVELY